MKNLLIALIASGLLLLFFSCETDFSNLNKQGIYGIVKDNKTQEPIPFATVYLNGTSNTNTQTDANGNYRFENINTGDYLLSAEKEGYISTFVEQTVLLSNFLRVDISMEYRSMLSTDVLDFGSDKDELEIVVTNLLNETVDLDVEENEHWMTTNYNSFGLDPGESDIITVKLHRFMLNEDNYSVPLIVNIVEDFGFDIIESNVVTVNVTR